jgi:hypothetical protein
MKVKAKRNIATCITAGKEYEVMKDSKDLIIVGDDGYAVGLSRDYFEVEGEKELTPVEWLWEKLRRYDTSSWEVKQKIFKQAKEMEQKLINK